ncbi:MAG: hypothetical protein ACK4OM_04285 [Alphaproteobacteria bacterium]
MTSNTDKYYHNYKINNINVHYPMHSNLKDQSGNNKEQDLGSLIDETLSKANYNFSRLEKLNNEYKCSTNYYLTASETDTRPIPNCNDPVYIELTRKLKEATISTKNVKEYSFKEDLNTEAFKELNQKAINNLETLKAFTNTNLNKVNSAFEKALCDTNAEGWAYALTFGMGVIVNASRNNEFDGKIARTYNDALIINENLNKIGELLSIYPSNCDLHVDYIHM